MVLPGALDLDDEFIHQPQIALVLFPEVLFADLSGLMVTVFGSKGHVWQGTGHR